MTALSNFGHRQQCLLKALLHAPKGLSIDRLAQELGISRNAINQHLASLEKHHYIENVLQPSTGGRPGRVYILSPKGLELFPRHYSLFARLLLRLFQQKMGEESLKQCLADLGSQLAEGYSARVQHKATLEDRINEVKSIMYELGYETRPESDPANPLEIVASNCVFHELARDCREVCELDISLISSLLNGQVEHKECMVRGGQFCRFAIQAPSVNAPG